MERYTLSASLLGQGPFTTAFAQPVTYVAVNSLSQPRGGTGRPVPYDANGELDGVGADPHNLPSKLVITGDYPYF